MTGEPGTIWVGLLVVLAVGRVALPPDDTAETVGFGNGIAEMVGVDVCDDSAGNSRID